MTTLAAMRVVARHFNELGLAYTFLGAATLPLLVDDADILEIRPTLDIDLSVQVATLGEHYALEERLRGRGFRHDTREGAPICRWLAEGVTVDVMPTDGRVLGLASMWFEEAVQQAMRTDLGDGVMAPVISRPYFLATKLTAHDDRGAKDPMLSKDLEDIVTLFDGCCDPETLLRDCSRGARSFIVRTLRAHLENLAFTDAVVGNFRFDPVSRERAGIVMNRMRLVAGMTP
jgi:hypothetical protein